MCEVTHRRRETEGGFVSRQINPFEGQNHTDREGERGGGSLFPRRGHEPPFRENKKIAFAGRERGSENIPCESVSVKNSLSYLSGVLFWSSLT